MRSIQLSLTGYLKQVLSLTKFFQILNLSEIGYALNLPTTIVLSSFDVKIQYLQLCRLYDLIFENIWGTFREQILRDK